MRLLPTLLLLFLAQGFARAQTGGAPGADEIVRQAVARRAEAGRGSFTAAIHTTSVITINNDSSRLALIPAGTALYESIGQLYRDPAIGTRIRIHAERGSAPAAGLARTVVDNMRSLGEYFSIDDDEVVLLNTAIVSPLAADASRYYRYESGGRSTRAGVPVYRIEVRPATGLYPLFRGELYIAEGSYDLVESDLMPSEETAIPFVRELHLVQRYAPVAEGGYAPDSISITGRGSLRAVALGIVEPGIGFAITGRLSDRHLNVRVPDSIRIYPAGISIAANADSVPAGFWATHGVLTAEQARTLDAGRGIPKDEGPRFSALPYIDYNRAGGFTPGATVGVALGPVVVGGMGGYSFGLERAVGEGTIAITLGSSAPLQTIVRGGVFSQIATTTTGDKSYPRIMNTLVAASLHQDYYNFFRKDGWSAGADILYDPFRLAVSFERSRQFSIGNNARWALLTWTSKEFQENPPIEDGSYQTAQVELSSGRVTPFLKITPTGGLDLRWSVFGLNGRNLATDSRFALGEALVSISIPVVRTGYNPMTLTLLGAGGTGTKSLPTQYQFRLRTSAASFGKPGGFVSPPKGLYGGTQYVALGTEFNLTDLVWRAAGLPVYNGRGVELIVAGGSARYRQLHPTGYTGTGDQWYSEAGIGVSRIPLFLTDLIAGRVDLRWGLGPLGQFGANFTLVVPL